MKRVFARFWKKRIVATFLAGLFAVLPIMITLAVMAWVGEKARAFLGADSPLGKSLRALGLQFVTNQIVASVLGWLLVLVAIWLVGLLFAATARRKALAAFNHAIESIPLVSAIYKPVSRVIALIRKDSSDDIKTLSVVYCTFGQSAAGCLGLLASPKIFRFHDQDCRIVYLPTSPIPMSGGILFLPVDSVHEVNLSVDDMMQIYFSLGVLASQCVPPQYAS